MRQEIMVSGYIGIHAVITIACTRTIEQTDDGSVFLEGADEGGDHDVKDLRRHQGNRDSPEDFTTGSTIDLGSIVILFIDTLKTG